MGVDASRLHHTRSQRQKGREREKEERKKDSRGGREKEVGERGREREGERVEKDKQGMRERDKGRDERGAETNQNLAAYNMSGPAVASSIVFDRAHT